LFICFSGQTMLMMNSFVSKQEKRTKLLSINKICSLIAEEGRSSKQTLAFFSLFFYAYYSGHSRHTLYIGWLWSECRSFFFFPMYGDISIYKESRRGVWMRLFVSSQDMRYQPPWLLYIVHERYFWIHDRV